MDRRGVKGHGHWTPAPECLPLSPRGPRCPRETVSLGKPVRDVVPGTFWGWPDGTCRHSLPGGGQALGTHRVIRTYGPSEALWGPRSLPPPGSASPCPSVALTSDLRMTQSSPLNNHTWTASWYLEPNVTSIPSASSSVGHSPKPHIGVVLALLLSTAAPLASPLSVTPECPLCPLLAPVFRTRPPLPARMAG